jgi:hypothetical protein
MEAGTFPGSTKGTSILATYYTAFLEMIALDLKREIYGVNIWLRCVCRL